MENAWMYIVALIAVTLIILIFVKTRGGDKKKAYQFLVDKFKFQLQKEKYAIGKHLFTLSGEYKSYSVTVNETKRKNTDNNPVYTLLSFENLNGSEDFRIVREYFMHRIFKFFGMREVEFDQYDTDKSFFFKANDHRQFKELFSKDILDKMMNLKSPLLGVISYEDNRLSYKIPGELTKEKEAEQFAEMLEIFYLIAEKLKK